MMKYSLIKLVSKRLRGFSIRLRKVGRSVLCLYFSVKNIIVSFFSSVSFLY